MILIDNSRVTLKIVASLTDNTRDVIYNSNMFIVQTTGVINLHTFSVAPSITIKNSTNVQLQ
jgi:hypothetical protein